MITALAVISPIAIFGGLALLVIGASNYDDETASVGLWLLLTGSLFAVFVGIGSTVSAVQDSVTEIDALRLQVEELTRELERQ